jgi:hypothetical protein
MTLWHFVNTAALVFAPPYVVFRSRLMEYVTIWTLVQTGLFFAASELAKVHRSTGFQRHLLVLHFSSHVQILILGTLGMGTIAEPTSFSLFAELFSSLLQVVGVVGMWLLLNRFNSTLKTLPSNDLRVLCAGLSWAMAESALHYLPALWMEARGPEFDWRFIYMGVNANIDLPLHLAFAAAVFVMSRRDVGAALLPVCAAIVAVYVLMPSITWYLFQYCLWLFGGNFEVFSQLFCCVSFCKFVLGFPLMMVFGTRAAIAVVVALTARTVFRTYEQQQAKKQ